MDPRMENNMTANSTPPPQRLGVFRMAMLACLLAVIFSLPALEGSSRQMDYFGNLLDFLRRFFPPDLSVLPEISRALLETFQIAVLATVFATILAIPIAIAASQNVSPRPIVWAVRGLLNLVRSIPSLIWALLAVAVVGANSLAGVVALVFYSLGYLGKFFSDAVESSDPAVADALRLSGAHPIQIFQYGIWPHAKPLIWSHALWMLEYNIRSAAIIGYVGAGGIGVWLHTYQEFGQWDKFSAVLFCILVVVFFLDFLGSKLRGSHGKASQSS